LPRETLIKLLAAFLTGVLAFSSLAFSSLAFSSLAFPSPASRESFDMAVPAPPSPVTIDGREWLIYELHLTNFTGEPLRIDNVEVLPDGIDARAEVRTLQPRERAIVYLEIPMDAKRPHRLLRHRVRYAAGKATDLAEVVGGEAEVRAKARLALGPPLRGGPWAAVYAWEWPRGHRRVFYTLDGRARVPGRFAIDWVRKDEQGNSARGDADVVKNSLGYGADVLAVADARVAAVRDGIAETDRVSANPKHTLEEAAGNFIALDLGDGRFAIYEHLKPGSIRVATGDRVRRGEVLASLGFTGDSTEPHLHFHVADSPSPLSGDGVPYEFEWKGVRGRPAPNSLVTFD
jgi:murein DD-endopeptidase MepM/ murein hydrolase activator NlpD